MPRYQITSPDGREVTIEGPRPPNQEDAAKIFASLPAKASAPVIAIPEAGESPAAGRTMEGGLLGEVGLPVTATSEPFRGGGMVADILAEGVGGTAGQAVGALTGPLAPAMIPILGGTGAGFGNYAAQKRRIAAGEQDKVSIGEILSSIGTGMIPGASLAASGARSIAREGLKQAAGGLLAKNVQTIADEGRMATPTEGVLSTVIPAAGGATAQRIQAANPRIQAAVAAAPPPSVSAQTLQAAQELGAIVPPSAVNPSWLNKRVESMAGPADVKRGASEANERVMKEVAARELLLPEGTEITMPVLRDVRARASQAYADVAALSPEAAADLGRLRDARSRATLEFGHYNKSGVPGALRRADAAQEEADLLEAALEGHATAASQPELMARLREARTLIAKSHDIEKALNLGSAAVDAKVIGRQFDKGRPLSGDLATMGAFAEAFPGAVQPVSGRQPVGLSKTEWLMGGLLASGAGAATGSPYALLSAAVPAATSTAARRLVLSRPYQRALANFPPPAIDAVPDISATAIRQFSQAAGGNEEAGKLFASSGSMVPPIVLAVAPTTSRPASPAPTSLLSLSPPDRAKAIDDTLKTLSAAEQLAYWKKLSAQPDVLTQEVRDEVARLQGGIPTLTPAEAKATPPGTQFRGSNGNSYEKMPDGKIRKI